MIIPVLRYPGTFIAGLDPTEAHQALVLMHVLEGAVIDAAIALERFRASRAGSAAYPDMPSVYGHRVPFLYARAFLYALDTIAKTLAVLSESPGAPAGLASVRDSWDRAFPDVKAVRDTSHHPEDRARGLGRRGKSISPLPVETGAVRTDGGVIVLDQLDDDHFGATLADGTYGAVEVTAAALRSAAHHVQRALECFQWEGWERRVPS